MRTQIHGHRSFDRAATMPGLAVPSLRVQFHAPVRFDNIRGPFRFSFQLEAPAVTWGKDGRFWAFLHDFDARSVCIILDLCRAASYERRGGFATPFEVWS